MTDDQIESTRQQVQQAEQQLQIERANQQRAQDQINKARAQLSSQQFMRQMGGIEGLRQRQLIGSKVNTANEQLRSRNQQIESYASEVAKVRGQIQEVDQAKADYDLAVKALDNPTIAANLTGRPRVYFEKLVASQDAAVKSAVADIEEQAGASFTPEVRARLANELKNNLGKISNEKLNAKINSIVSPGLSGNMSVEVPKISAVPALPVQGVTAPSIVNEKIVRPLTLGERTRQAIAKYTGIGLPPGKVIYNRAFRGAEPGTYQETQPVNALDVVASPITAAGTAAKVIGSNVQTGLERLGYTGVVYNIPERSFPQKVTSGGEFRLAESQLRLFTPSEVGFAAGTAATAPLLAAAPLEIVGLMMVSSGFSKLATPKTYIPQGEDTAFRKVGAVGEIALGGVLAYVGLRQPTIRVSAKPETSFFAQDVVQPIVNNGKLVNKVDYVLTASTPARTASVNTKFGRVFFSDKIVEVSPARVDISRPLAPVYIQDGEIVSPAIINTFKKGSKYGYLSKLEASQSPEFTPEIFSTLPETERMRLVKIAEAKTGVPVSEANTPLVLGKNFKYQLGSLSSTEFARANPSEGTINWFEPGKRITRASTVSTAKPFESNSIFQFELAKPRVNVGNEFFKGINRNVEGYYDPKTAQTYIRNNLPKELAEKIIKHEQGHFYERGLGIEKDLTLTERKIAFEKAKQHLTKKYGQDIPYSENQYISEYIADLYRGKVPRGEIQVKQSQSPDAPFQVFETKTVLKDTTKPNYRASGNTPTIYGISKVYKPVDITPPESYSLGTGSPKTVQKTNPQQVTDVLGQAKGAAAKNILRKVSKSNSYYSNKAENLLESTEAPIYTGGLKSTRGSFTAQGNYERTEPAQQLKAPTSQRSIIDTKSIESPLQVDSQKQINLTREDQITKEPQLVLQSPKTETSQKQTPSLGQVEIEILKQTQKQKQTTDLVGRQTTKTTNSTPRPLPPVLKIKLGRKADENLLAKVRSKLRKSYDVFVRRKGKDIKVASGLPIGRAKQAGVKRNLKDLSASFTLKEQGFTDMPDIDFEAPSNLFRPSKRDRNRLVQVAKSRLSARTEVSEIQSARRRKTKKIKWF